MTIYYSELPCLLASPHRKTSDPTSEENCIAHAVGARGEWWEPIIGRIWPIGPPHYNYKVGSLVRVFERLGFVSCDSSEHEPGYDKVAIYGKDDEYTHVARQLSKDGTWTSKLGPEDDIGHATLDALADGSYGSVITIMKRSRSDNEQTKCCEDAVGSA